jgi:hypothetical protein
VDFSLVRVLELLVEQPTRQAAVSRAQLPEIGGQG